MGSRPPYKYLLQLEIGSYTFDASLTYGGWNCRARKQKLCRNLYEVGVYHHW